MKWTEPDQVSSSGPDRPGRPMHAFRSQPLDIDQRTTVFTLGRTALILMDQGDREQAWRGTAGQLDVLRRATRPDPGERYRDVAEFVDAWRAAA